MNVTVSRKCPSLAPLERVALGGLVALGVARALDPAKIADGPTVCPFRLLTGLPCPGCGLTRSWVFAAHGQWTDAMAANAFGIPLLIATLAMSLVLLVLRVRRQSPPALDPLLRRPVVVAIFALWGVYGAVRMATVA